MAFNQQRDSSKCMKIYLTGFIMALTIIIGAITAPRPAYAGSLKLVMYEARNCLNCRQFKREMMAKYKRSATGRAMPLERIDADNRAAVRKYRLKRPISFTPIFVVIKNGREVSRFIGYMGPSKFMHTVRSLLKRHTAQAPKPAAQRSKATL